MQDATHLLRIEFRKLLLGHKINEEVISNLRVSIDTFTVSLSNTLCKNTRIFGVEEQVDSSEFNVASLTIVPVSRELKAFIVIGVD